MRPRLFLFSLVFLTLLIQSCGLFNPQGTFTPAPEPNMSLFKDNEITDIYSNTEAADLEISDFLYLGMRDIYYWRTRVPNVNVASFPTPDSLLRFTIARPEDRFSDIKRDGISFYNELVMGTTSAIFGFELAYNGVGQARIVRVLSGSSAEQAGLKRGMRIIAFNGTPIPGTSQEYQTLRNTFGMSLMMEVENASGSRQTFTIMRTVFNENVVPIVRTYTVAGKKVGYLLLTSFTQSAVNELQTAFATLKNENVTELVLDLRYNGGGSVGTAGVLCSHIAAQLSGTPYVKIMFNNRYQKNNGQAVMSRMPNSLSLTRLFVITTARTASASELTINALRPYIDVKTVGSRSFGKPVGSNIVIHQKSGYMLLPISFAYTNALGQADFINGFAPDIPAADDITRDFGDPQETSLRAALFFIENGRAPVAAKTAAEFTSSKPTYLWEQGEQKIPAILLPNK